MPARRQAPSTTTGWGALSGSCSTPTGRAWARLLTELVLGTVRAFAIDCSQFHADSTSVTLSGLYRDAHGRPRGGKPTAYITYGHNKDHHPDLKQLVRTLTVAADGAVPVAYRTDDGNTSEI